MVQSALLSGVQLLSFTKGKSAFLSFWRAGIKSRTYSGSQIISGEIQGMIYKIGIEFEYSGYVVNPLLLYSLQYLRFYFLNVTFKSTIRLLKAPKKKKKRKHDAQKTIFIYLNINISTASRATSFHSNICRSDQYSRNL